MKKSRSVTLVLLGSASAALAACDDGGALPANAQFYPTVNECVAEHDAATCAEAKAVADRTQAVEAPRFSRKEECEQQFGAGNCETRQTAGGSFFFPLMMGYMMGNMMSGGRYAQPVYRGPNSTAIMPSGGRLLNVGRFDNIGAGRTAFRPAPQITPVGRGGFGSTAANYRTTAGG
jgi:uncharacterized protein YgiB involved in biofilm formation